jgi:hypothetical protein
MNAEFRAQGKDITVNVVRQNGAIMYDYTLGAGTYSLSTLPGPFRNITITGDVTLN